NGDLKAQIATPSSGSCTKDWPPAIANLDGVGPAEVIMGGQVARYTGGANPKIEVVWSVPPTSGTWGTISIAEDLDGDGKMEVITGTQVFDGTTGAAKSKPIMNGL